MRSQTRRLLAIIEVSRLSGIQIRAVRRNIKTGAVTCSLFKEIHIDAFIWIRYARSNRLKTLNFGGIADHASSVGACPFPTVAANAERGIKINSFVPPRKHCLRPVSLNRKFMNGARTFKSTFHA